MDKLKDYILNKTEEVNINIVDSVAPTDGGGGDSDLFISELKINNTTGTDVSLLGLIVPVLFSDGTQELIRGILEVVYIPAKSHETLNVICHKSVSTLLIDSENTLTGVTLTGNIEESEIGVYLITGDCEMTIHSDN